MEDLRPPHKDRAPHPSPAARPPAAHRTRGAGPARLALVAATAVVTGLSGCGAISSADPAGTSSPAARPSGATPGTRTGSDGPVEARPTEGAGAARALPTPGKPLPATPAELATALRETTAALNAAVDRWKPAKGAPPRDVELLALYQQRLYRHAARHRTLADRAFARLPAALAAQARDNVGAIRELLALARPIKPSAVFKVQPARPAAELLGHFKRGERRFGVEWEVLAAVMFAETKFGRVRSDSHAGAQGPMQFMPATWRAYGMGGDVQDPRDAIMGAANYLRAGGAPRDYRRALHAYNPSQAYVNAILLHARQMKRDPRAYYAYYNWQVFVLTTAGERRLTGPK
ncbi:lytic murein transglycosylase [Nonomuraea wenchangensis]|uniref:lytic transglycosylase domain-containing protein n=1 Tax=Nonomuraea wenchangensis TaxID=568860 RepID=UPI0038500A0C